MKRRLFRIGRQRWEQKDGKFQPVLLEKHVVKELIVRLWANQIKVWQINNNIGGHLRPNVAGIPDLMGHVPRRTELVFGGACYKTTSAIPLYIEVKRPGGVRSAAQIRFIEQSAQDGCVAFFADSWDSCKAELAKFGIKTQ